METLKLTTLAILIPIGSLMSEAATAYPESTDRPEIADRHGPEAHCAPRASDQPAFQTPLGALSGPPEALATWAGPASTTSLHQDRDPQNHVCGLHLDLIEMD